MSLEEKIHVVLERLVSEGRGIVAAVAIIGSEGLPIAHILPPDVDPESFAASMTTAFGAINASLSMFGGKVSRIDIRKDDNSHLIGVPIADGFLIIQTPPNPNLGLLFLLIERYAKDLELLIT